MTPAEIQSARLIFSRLLGWESDGVGQPAPVPTDETLEREMARLMEQRGYSELLDLLLVAEKAQPDSPWIQHRIGIVLRVTGDFSAALTRYERALRLDPAFPTGIAHYCYTLHLMGDTVRAVNVLNLYLAMNNADGDAAKIQRMIARQSN